MGSDRSSRNVYFSKDTPNEGFVTLMIFRGVFLVFLIIIFSDWTSSQQNSYFLIKMVLNELGGKDGEIELPPNFIFTTFLVSISF
jgi:hypothetical protein